MEEKTVDIQRCPYAGKCGGCSMTGRPYGEQLKVKQKHMTALLGDIARSQKCEIGRIVGADDPLYYRNKVHSVFARDGRGRIIRGMYREESHDVVNVNGCLLEDRDADAIIEEVKRLLPSFKLKVYDETLRTGLIRHVLVRVGHIGDRKQIMVVIVTTEPMFPSKSNFAKTLRSRFPDITTIVQNINPRHTSMVLGSRNEVIWGKGYIEDELMGLKFRISPASFYQINHDQTEKLYSLALEAAALTGRESVLDAYCGTGTIGMMMAPHAGSVVGVELNPDAVRDAIGNAKANAIKNISFVNKDATAYMTEAAARSAHFDVVCMDPPRSGSTPEFIEAVARLKVGKVVYVSCGPESLARDLKVFTAKGYHVERITPVDMFPQTEHVETVCLLSKLHEAKHHVSVKFDMDEMDLTSAESKATYEEIKKYVAEHNDGMKVSSLNIAQVKRKCGIELTENFNLPKSEDSRQPQCPKEKEEAIVEALKAFQMI